MLIDTLFKNEDNETCPGGLQHHRFWTSRPTCKQSTLEWVLDADMQVFQSIGGSVCGGDSAPAKGADFRLACTV